MRSEFLQPIADVYGRRAAVQHREVGEIEPVSLSSLALDVVCECDMMSRGNVYNLAVIVAIPAWTRANVTSPTSEPRRLFSPETRCPAEATPEFGMHAHHADDINVPWAVHHSAVPRARKGFSNRT